VRIDENLPHLGWRYPSVSGETGVRDREAREALTLCQRSHHLLGSQDVDHPLDVVGQHRQAHLTAHVGQSTGEEVALVDTVLDRPKRMLRDCFPPLRWNQQWSSLHSIIHQNLPVV